MQQQLRGKKQQLVFAKHHILLNALLGGVSYSSTMKHTLLVRGKFQKLDANSTSITGAKPSAMHLKKIGEVRSILPKGVHCLCFTATATKSLRRKVSGVVGLRNPKIIAISPCKRNIVY